MKAAKVKYTIFVQYIYPKALTLSITRLHKERSPVLAI